MKLSDKSTMKNSFYKYRPLYLYDADGNRVPHPFTQSIFDKAEIWYSAPKDFNDPFDCNLQVHVNDSTDAEWEEYCDKLIEAYPDEFSKVEVIKTRKIWRTNPKLAQSIGGATFRETHYVNSSVYCFSKTPKSISMFSYYADSHKGIAIEFEFEYINLPCGIIIGDLSNSETFYNKKIVIGDVKYPASYPDLNYHRLYDKPELVFNTLFTKHLEWAHEEEFRIFRRNVPASTVVFEKKLVTRIIFGCKAGQEEIDLVKGWLDDWPSDVVLAKAKIATNKFELEIEDFETVAGTSTM